MTILDRLVARQFLMSYLILLLVGIGLYILTDLLVNIDEFIEDQAASTPVLPLLVDFYGHNLPLYFSQLAAPVMAIAASFTLGTMLRNNELTALVSAGMPLQRLIAPIAVCALLMIGLWVMNRELVMPRYATKIARTHDDIVGARTESVQYARDANNAILTAVRFYPRYGLLRSVCILETGSDGRAQAVIEADEARYDRAADTWRLERGTRKLLSPPADRGALDGALEVQPIDRYDFTLDPEQIVLRRDAEWADLLSIRQLNELLHSRNLANRGSLAMTLHQRSTQPIFQVVLLLLVAPFFLTREPGQLIAAAGRALVLAGAFFGTAFVLQTLVQDEGAAALLAWFPIIIFGPIAIVQLVNVKT